jgi:hypothetical protein
VKDPAGLAARPRGCSPLNLLALGKAQEELLSVLALEEAWEVIPDCLDHSRSILLLLSGSHAPHAPSVPSSPDLLLLPYGASSADSGRVGSVWVGMCCVVCVIERVVAAEVCREGGASHGCTLGTDTVESGCSGYSQTSFGLRRATVVAGGFRDCTGAGDHRSATSCW